MEKRCGRFSGLQVDSACFSQLGFDALPTLSMTTSGWVGLMLVALGAVLMIKANATAWKQTGGY
jgi:hypothetical protein